jgi:hypothetical protein
MILFELRLLSVATAETFYFADSVPSFRPWGN